MAAGKARGSAPPELLRSLAAAVARDGLARGYVLRGEERYFQERSLALLRERAEAEGCEVCVHNGARGDIDFSVARVIDDLSGGGLFAERRFVVIRSPDEHLKPREEGEEGAQRRKAKRGPSALTCAILAFLEAREDPGTLVLLATSIRADHAVVKALRKAGGALLDFRKLYDRPGPWERGKPDPGRVELARWVAQRAREIGLRLGADQLSYVCAATGNDLFALDEALVRLKQLPDAVLGEVVGWRAGATPWAVADSVLEGDLERALEGVEALFRGGFQDKRGRRVLDRSALSIMLVNALVRGVRQALALALEIEGGLSGGEALRALRLRGAPASLELAARRAGRREAGTWRRMLDEALALERRAKDSPGLDVNDFARLALRWGNLAPSRS